MRSQGEDSAADQISAIEFFGKGSSSKTEPQDAAPCDEVEGESEVGDKRKRKPENLTVKSKKKKRDIKVDTQGKHEHFLADG